jgi:hypothetical protein
LAESIPAQPVKQAAAAGKITMQNAHKKRRKNPVVAQSSVIPDKTPAPQTVEAEINSADWPPLVSFPFDLNPFGSLIVSTSSSW